MFRRFLEQKPLLGQGAALLGVSSIVFAVMPPPWNVRLILLGAGVFALWLLWKLVSPRFGPYRASLSGMIEYRSEFAREDLKEILGGADRSVAYFGISGVTASVSIREWIAARNGRTARMLICDSAKANHGMLYGAQAWRTDSEPDTKEEPVAAGWIKSTMRQMRQPGVEIRTHRRLVNFWMYMIDNKRIYVGLLQRGGGQPSSLLVLENRRPNDMFSYYRSWWDSAWKEAKPAGKETADATEVLEAVRARPGWTDRVDLLERIRVFDNASLSCILPTVLGPEFLEYRESSEVRVSTLELLEAVSPKFEETERAVIARKLADRYDIEECRDVQACIAGAFCDFHTGADADRTVKLLCSVDRLRGADELRLDLLNLVVQGEGAVDRLLRILKSRCSRELQLYCLDELRRDPLPAAAGAEFLRILFDGAIHKDNEVAYRRWIRANWPELIRNRFAELPPAMQEMFPGLPEQTAAPSQG